MHWTYQSNIMCSKAHLCLCGCVRVRSHYVCAVHSHSARVHCVLALSRVHCALAQQWRKCHAILVLRAIAGAPKSIN